MTYKQLAQTIDSLTKEPQNHSVAIWMENSDNFPQRPPSYPYVYRGTQVAYDVESDRHVEIHGAVFVYGEDNRLDEGHFVVAI